jgi:hypothetical protein
MISISLKHGVILAKFELPNGEAAEISTMLLNTCEPVGEANLSKQYKLFGVEKAFAGETVLSKKGWKPPKRCRIFFLNQILTTSQL